MSKRTHGLSSSPEYKVWQQMKDRSFNQNNADYSAYGGRGIVICDEWRDDFQAFYDHTGPRPAPGLSVDRIDNGKGYEPGNVRWATIREQLLHTRRSRILTLNGRSQTMTEWAEELGMKFDTLHMRMHRGWSVERALSQPVQQQRSKKGGKGGAAPHRGM